MPFPKFTLMIKYMNLSLSKQQTKIKTQFILLRNCILCFKLKISFLKGRLNPTLDKRVGIMIPRKLIVSRILAKWSRSGRHLESQNSETKKNYTWSQKSPAI